MLGDIKGDAESGKAERERQSGVQEAAEKFVELVECHGNIPRCRFAVPTNSGGSDQVRGYAHRDAEKRNGEGQRQGGVQEVAEIFVVENGHRLDPWVGSP